MSVETEKALDVVTAAGHFAAGLADTAEYKEYEAATDSFRNDNDARALLRRFQTAQQNAQWRADNNDDPETIQAEVMNNPILTRYFASQESLVTLLRSTNDYMAEKLGFDFADLTKPAGGCC